MATELESAFHRLLTLVVQEVMREEFARPTVNPAPSRSVGTTDRLLLRSSETAKLMGISSRYLHSLTTAGVIPHVRLGRVVGYSPDAIREWIRSKESTTRSQPTTRPPSPPQTIDSATKSTRHLTKSRKATKSRTSKAAGAVAEKERHVSPKSPDKVPVVEKPPRSFRSYFAKQFGVPEDTWPAMTNGDIMRATGLTVPEWHGWVYHNREIPTDKMAKLKAFAASFLPRS